MKIAVLMSTYNGKEYLDKQLKSIAEQTVIDDLTLYIRDDGSKDNTFDIINEWKNKIDIVLYKEQNVGPAMSFWKLLMKPEIRADYYAFCDQDDIWDQDKLEKGIEKLKDNTHLYACNCRIIDENDKIIKTERVMKKPDMNIQKLFVSGCTQGCSMIFTDSLCQYLRCLNIKCIPMHDIILMLYANFFGKIYWDIIPHFGYRVHSNNVVAKANKSVFQRIQTTYWNWKNSSKNSMKEVAKEMLKNIDNLEKNDQIYLKKVSEYKKSIIKKLQLILNSNLKGINSSCVRSYRMRIILNLY